MTVKELFTYAVKEGFENLEIGLQYQDGGGEYCGDTFKAGDEISYSIQSSKGREYVLLS